MNHLIYPHAERHAAAWVFTLGLFFALAVLVTAGCVPEQALIQAATQRDVNGAHALDEDLPVEARAIGADAEDAFSAQLYLLDGTKMPPHVIERMRARGDLPEDYRE